MSPLGELHETGVPATMDTVEMKVDGVVPVVSRCGEPLPRAGKVWGPVPTPPPGYAWEDLMQLALDEAARAKSQGEIPVGAVVVSKEGRLLGRGHNCSIKHSDPSAHAEIMALRSAGASLGNYRLENCVLVVTLEPCLMCTGAIVHARLGGLVYGAADDRAGAVESCLNGLDLPFLNHRVWHMGGIAADRCAELLRAFFREARMEPR